MAWIWTPRSYAKKTAPMFLLQALHSIARKTGQHLCGRSKRNMEITVTLSANAGVCICAGNDTVWVDALHSIKLPGFSCISPELFNALMGADKFPAPKAICFTHNHPDHYSAGMVDEALKQYQTAKLILPWTCDADSWRIGNMVITCCKLPHDGDKYANLPHYGYLISVEGKNILIPGDCRLCDPTLLEFVNRRAIDLALLNFPWYTLKKAHAFVAEQLQPRCTVLYHLPFTKDDCNGYRAVAEKTIQAETNAFLLIEPLQQLTLDS